MKTSLDTKGITYWNKLTAMERLHFVLSHQGLFLNSRLVNPGELLAARSAPESAREYIVEREESPFFSAVDVKKGAEMQKDFIRLATTLGVALSLSVILQKMRAKSLDFVFIKPKNRGEANSFFRAFLCVCGHSVR